VLQASLLLLKLPAFAYPCCVPAVADTPGVAFVSAVLKSFLVLHLYLIYVADTPGVCMHPCCCWCYCCFCVFAVVEFPAVAGVLAVCRDSAAADVNACCFPARPYFLKHSFVLKLNNFLCLHKCIGREADFRDAR
jgi:hypothetical protein